MTVALSAVARRFSTASMRNGERAWQSIVREMEASQQKTSAAAETGCLRPAGRRNVVVHLMVIIQSDNNQKQYPGEMFLRLPTSTEGATRRSTHRTGYSVLSLRFPPKTVKHPGVSDPLLPGVK